jgi:phosphogluconate dehydratase
VDAEQGTLDVLVPQQDWEGRQPAEPSHQDSHGTGRELFAGMRQLVGRADQGAHVFGPLHAVNDPAPTLQESSR